MKTHRERWLRKPRRRCGTAPGPNFCKPRAQWPGRNRGTPLRFCAPEMFCPLQGVTPVTGSGESGPMDLGEAQRSRSPSAASPAILWLLSHRWESNPPRRAELSRRPQAAKLPAENHRSGASRRPRPTKQNKNPLPTGQKNLRMHRRGGGNIPTPLFTRLFDLCPFAVSPSDDGSLSQTQWVRRTRPLARRRASTLRPLRVAIRLRKPCSLERWRFLG